MDDSPNLNPFTSSKRTKVQDLTGQRFERLVVLSAVHHNGTKKYRCTCQCDCGERIEAYYYGLLNGAIKSCGCWSADHHRARRGAQRFNWKGGRKKDGRGYIELLQPDGSYRMEHIIVVEQRLGRALLNDETVHHKNGIRNDNTPDNLELRVRAKHPAGASVSDLLKWAHELIERYE
jgi:hypothetical protein